jgi:RNA polymerase subunit RPABC4/transcription elongation factor Spt4
MSSNKYVCPECGSNLKVWKEYLVTKRQSINPSTGEVGKRINVSVEEELVSGMIGLECSNCTWSVNVVNQSSDLDDTLSEWWDEHEEDINV